MSRAPFYAASMRSVCHPVGPDDWGNSFVEHPELPHDWIAGVCELGGELACPSCG